jgi:quinol monooxygenase YgiN
MADAPLLTVFAELHAKPGKEESLRDALKGLIAPTRQESGYVQYDLHVDNDDPGHFFFYENWVSRAHLDAHLAAPHLVDFIAREDELLAEPVRLVFATKVA